MPGRTPCRRVLVASRFQPCGPDQMHSLVIQVQRRRHALGNHACASTRVDWMARRSKLTSIQPGRTPRDRAPASGDRLEDRQLIRRSSAAFTSRKRIAAVASALLASAALASPPPPGRRRLRLGQTDAIRILRELPVAERPDRPALGRSHDADSGHHMARRLEERDAWPDGLRPPVRTRCSRARATCRMTCTTG
jgi:hypothetical protein